MVGVIVIIVLFPNGIRALRQASQAQGTFAGNCSLVLMCVFSASWEVMTSVPAVDRYAMGKALELCQACVGFDGALWGFITCPQPGQAHLYCSPWRLPVCGAEATSCLSPRGGGRGFDPPPSRGGHRKARFLAASGVRAKI